MIEVKGYEGQGFQTLVTFGSWRVAVLRYLDEISPERLNTMERHIETEEVFVLVKGAGMLVLAGNSSRVMNVQTIAMKIGDTYNVKKNAWHTIVLSEDAHVIVVENEGTNEHNSEYSHIPSVMRIKLQQAAREFLRDCV